jgi:DNA-binding transcriptional LysR family regulator
VPHRLAGAAQLRQCGADHGRSWDPRDRSPGRLPGGRLVRLLEGWEAPPLPIHAVYPTRRFPAPKVRAMGDVLTEAFDAALRLNGRALSEPGTAPAPQDLPVPE